MNVQRGDIVLVDYPYASGTGAKVRPVLVVQNNRDNQRLLNTTLYYSRAPDSTPSFVNDHFEAVLERLPKQWGWVGRNEADISPIVVSAVPYTPWSDNSTWAAHGVPSALLMSWPDESARMIP